MTPKPDEQDPSQIGTPESTEPTPHLNSRTQALKEVSERSDADAVRDATESVQQVDEEGNPIEAAQSPVVEPSEVSPPSDESVTDATGGEPRATSADESAASPASRQAGQPPTPFDPSLEYEIEVDGVRMKVPGSKILDAGFRTFQKETAADLRLNLASKMLRDAEARANDTTPQGASTKSGRADVSSSAGELSDLELAQALQLGSEEQATAAIAKLRESGRAVSPEDITKFVMEQMPAVVTDQISFREGVQFAQTEYDDILKNDSLRTLFFIEEERLRVGGDKRTYRDIYKTVGDKIRKEFKLTAKEPTSTTPATNAARQAAKSAAPSVPTTAAARIEAAPEKTPLTHEERLDKMRASRHQTSLV